MAEESRAALEGGAWERAKADAMGVYRTPWFGLGAAIVELLAVPAAVLLTSDADTSTTTQVAVPILAGAVALVIAFLSIFVAQLAAAPYRQRNELRRHVRSLPEGGTTSALLLEREQRANAERQVRKNEAVALRRGGHDVLDELSTIEVQVEAAQREGNYSFDFELPAENWDKQRQTIAALASPETRKTVAHAYVLAAQLNRRVEAPEHDGSEVEPADGLSGLLTAVRKAKAVMARELERVSDDT
jgi:hypothetical protein